ncbi:MAG: hypothetical protein AAGA06_00645, partial [Pseudomonadota bacterium]
QAVKGLNDPEQDNISFAVIKVRHEKPVIRPKRRGNVTEVDFHTTRLADEATIEGIEETIDDAGAKGAAADEKKEGEQLAQQATGG